MRRMSFALVAALALALAVLAAGCGGSDEPEAAAEPAGSATAADKPAVDLIDVEAGPIGVASARARSGSRASTATR